MEKNPRSLLFVHSSDPFPFSDLGMNFPFQGEGGYAALTPLSHPFLVAMKRSYIPSLDLFLLMVAVVSGYFCSWRISCGEKLKGKDSLCTAVRHTAYRFPSEPLLLHRICLTQLDSVALSIPAALRLSNVLRSSMLWNCYPGSMSWFWPKAMCALPRKVWTFSSFSWTSWPPGSFCLLVEIWAIHLK